MEPYEQVDDLHRRDDGESHRRREGETPERAGRIGGDGHQRLRIMGEEASESWRRRLPPGNETAPHCGKVTCNETPGPDR
ncbi:hypothetical protein Airi02_087420 [Actinoallomurus iriomotensis]|uniref:Uncharacterized protein n=1 Tax=Actinoallomurus iriomotensis TaxID=478107 RepID=A0A9W6SC33_9ACTN|nr:hypothetical protein Airi02_087420 [Actinoallomurus iriomotensis]